MSNESKTLLTQIQELQAQNTSYGEEIKAVKAINLDLTGKLEAKTAELTVAVAAKVAAESAAKASSDELTAVKGELSSAKAQLGNPAFVDASRKGSAGAGSEAGVASSQGSDALTKEQALDAYNKLTDPKAKAEFRKANWKVLGIQEEK